MTAHPALLPLIAARADWHRLIDTVTCVDWADLLAALPPASVDLLLTDAPYNTTACEWEIELDLVAWWAAVKRVMKPRGAVVMTASQPFTSKLVMSNLAWFRYEWVWEKSLATGYLNANRNPMKAHENILVFYSGLGAFNPQMTNGKAYRATRGAVGGHVRDKSVGGYITENNGLRFPRSVLHFNSALSPLHPTQKPVALFAYLIRTYTRPGALVVDPFCGSGTTAVAARNEKRRWICGDLSPEYVALARERVRDVPSLPKTMPDGSQQLPLFAAAE